MTTDQFDDIIEDIMTSTWESGRTKIISLCKQMCDKQKEICANNASARIHSYDQPVVNKNTIINTPYPEELL